MGFWSKMFGVKTQEAREAIEEAIVSFDPEAAGKAEIEEYREELTKISTFVVQAQKEYEREVRETEEWKSKIDESMMALEILESDYIKTTGNDKDELESLLNDLMLEVEESNNEYERELVEDAEAKSYLDELLQREKEISKALKDAQKTLTSVQRSYETQKIRTDRAKEREEALKTGGKKLGTASKILNRELERLKIEESVSKRVLGLSENSSVTTSNSRVKDALARARGASASSNSIASRLEALKARNK